MSAIQFLATTQGNLKKKVSSLELRKPVADEEASDDDNADKYGPKIINPPPLIKDFKEIEGDGFLSIAQFNVYGKT